MTQESPSLQVTLRRAEAGDVEIGSKILFEAFKAFAEQRGFEPDFPSIEIARTMATIFLNHPKFYGVAAEAEGAIVGVNFLDERNAIRGIGPIAVDPHLQGRRIGRALMQAVIDRAKDAPGVRLVQDASNPMSLALYASLGFEVREPLFLLYGTVQTEAPDGYLVRPMTREDLKACGDLCEKTHGFHRNGELEDALGHFGAMVAIRRGRIVAYASAPTLWVMNHGVAETEKDLKALLAHAGVLKGTPLSLLVPGRQNALLQWCLAAGMRIAKPMTLMTRGTYQMPATPWFPSVTY